LFEFIEKRCAIPAEFNGFNLACKSKQGEQEYPDAFQDARESKKVELHFPAPLQLTGRKYSNHQAGSSIMDLA
jgi:hypothetical protein